MHAYSRVTAELSQDMPPCDSPSTRHTTYESSSLAKDASERKTRETTISKEKNQKKGTPSLATATMTVTRLASRERFRSLPCGPRGTRPPITALRLICVRKLVVRGEIDRPIRMEESVFRLVNRISFTLVTFSNIILI